MFTELSYSCDERRLFYELASTCYLAASGFCEKRKSALMVLYVYSSRTDLLELGSVANDIFGKIQDACVFLNISYVA